MYMFIFVLDTFIKIEIRANLFAIFHLCETVIHEYVFPQLRAFLKTSPLCIFTKAVSYIEFMLHHFISRKTGVMERYLCLTPSKYNCNT